MPTFSAETIYDGSSVTAPAFGDPPDVVIDMGPRALHATTVPYQHEHHIVVNDDVPSFAASLLLAEQQTKPRLRSFARALGQGAQALERLCYNVLLGTSLDLAQGVHLDRWGELVNEARGALDQVAYRQFIEFRAQASTIGDDTPEVVALLERMVTPLTVRAWPMFPCGVQYEISGGAYIGDAKASRIAAIMNSIRPNGVITPIVQRLPDGATPDTVFGSGAVLNHLIYSGR